MHLLTSLVSKNKMLLDVPNQHLLQARSVQLPLLAFTAYSLVGMFALLTFSST